MATSVGAGIARGLESGFRLAMDVQDRQVQQQRQARADARQAVLDNELLQDRQDQRRRLGLSDAERGLGLAEAGLQRRLVGLDAAGATPDEATQRAVVDEARQIQQQRDALARGYMDPSYDPRTAVPQAQKRLQALANGDLSVFEREPGAFTQTMTALLGRDPRDYVRGAPGQPSAIEAAVQDLQAGLEGGDQARAVRGANVLFSRDVRKGIGTKGQGGTIVDKRIVGLIPDPRSPAGDLRVVPMVRVYIRGDTPASGDEARTQRQAQLPPDAPAGATGFYDAPVTERRSADPDDPVRSVSVRQALDQVGQQAQLAEVMNRPEAAALLALDASSGWDPQQYLAVAAQYGVGVKRAEEKRKHDWELEQIRARGEETRKTLAQRGEQGLDAIEARGDVQRDVARMRVQGSLSVAQLRASMRGGGGGGSSGGEGAAKVQSRFTDADGNVVLVMRDGTHRALVGENGRPVKSLDYQRLIGSTARDISKTEFGNTPAQNRDAAKKLLGSDAAPAPGGKPGAKDYSGLWR
ncbi:hypothetical protein ABXN37_19855 [Piscinibacter sakaiensis]|nr:hypothetical protein [Piscinibacter sakaiensis]